MSRCACGRSCTRRSGLTSGWSRLEGVVQGLAPGAAVACSALLSAGTLRLTTPLPRQTHDLQRHACDARGGGRAGRARCVSTVAAAGWWRTITSVPFRLFTGLLRRHLGRCGGGSSRLLGWAPVPLPQPAARPNPASPAAAAPAARRPTPLSLPRFSALQQDADCVRGDCGAVHGAGGFPTDASGCTLMRRRRWRYWRRCRASWVAHTPSSRTVRQRRPPQYRACR